MNVFVKPLISNFSKDLFGVASSCLLALSILNATDTNQTSLSTGGTLSGHVSTFTYTHRGNTERARESARMPIFHELQWPIMPNVCPDAHRKERLQSAFCTHIVTMSP